MELDCRPQPPVYPARRAHSWVLLFPLSCRRTWRNPHATMPSTEYVGVAFHPDRSWPGARKCPACSLGANACSGSLPRCKAHTHTSGLSSARRQTSPAWGVWARAAPHGQAPTLHRLLRSRADSFRPDRLHFVHPQPRHPALKRDNAPDDLTRPRHRGLLQLRQPCAHLERTPGFATAPSGAALQSELLRSGTM